MIADLAAITRDPVTKHAVLTITAKGPWSVFAGKDADSLDFSRPLAAGTGPETRKLPVSAWACFAVRTEGYKDAPLLLAERHLPMAGGYNFRDLGGFTGADGRRVAWGRFFRTDGLGNLTDGDLAYLASIPVVTVADFRTIEENEHSPDRVPPSVREVLRLPIAPGYMSDRATRALEEYASPDEFMLEMYRDLALDPHITATYRRFFAAVQSVDALPLIFHCSAGKDRTGLAAALILTALGVDRQTILADYEASNGYLGDKYAPYIAKSPHLKGLFTVKRAFLEEAFRLLEDEYGSVAAYLETMLDVDIAAMRRRFLN
ncbi:MAG: tyrosine-protein phosphatase [Deltaproteobacteria bacterium]|nr:tyrosine-protein phosphatase [Deltaproteobacteria bacterium]